MIAERGKKMENENLEHSRDKYYKIGVIFIVLAVIATIVGSTFAYWSWQSSEAQKTEVTFTVTAGFSCSADGGGNISPGDISLAPAACTNENYAVKRTVTVKPTINIDGDVYMDLWLKVNSIGSGLAASQNFKYALTTSSSNCTTGVVAQGNFNGATTNTQKTLLHNKAYSQTTTETYYLWIWLDAAETSPTTMNQTFSMELGGVCTNQAPTTYSGTIYRYGASGVQLGNRIALQPFQAWCTNSTEFGNSCDFGRSWETESECEAYVADQNMENTVCEQGTVQPISYETNPSNLNKTFYLKHVIVDDIVTESYVEFVVTPTMATSNPGMTAGTYYLRGLDTYDVNGNCKSQYLNSSTGNCESPYYESNKTVLQNAFGSTYCTDYSSNFECRVSGLNAYADLVGYVRARGGDSAYCYVYYNGNSRCIE